jgi:hypothetical protein
MVSELMQQYIHTWWSYESVFPDFDLTNSQRDQLENGKKLETLNDGLIYQLKHVPQSHEERQAWQERLRPGLREYGRIALDLQPAQLDFIESSGLVDANIEFARMARKFDPGISGAHILQASHNVMTCNFFQLLLGLPVRVTPSIFAYSMLYPYTDNYLDDPAISKATKQSFYQRFLKRIQGQAVQIENPQEKIINNLINIIEDQWDRGEYPQVYDSLLAVHMAQGSSLKLNLGGTSPFEVDCLGISFEKGGTSVLADGYLIAGNLTPQEAKMMFGYGVFAQLIDDLEDIDQDLREGRMTIFSQTATYWPLDGLTNRLFSFGRNIMSDLTAFHSPAVPALVELISHGLDPILIDTVGRAGKYYRKEYLQEIESHFRFRFDFVRKQRQKLSRHKIDVGDLITAMT